MKHLVLFGNYRLSIDAKNRTIIPAELRRQLDPDRDGEAFYIVIGTDGRLWLYPERRYEQLIALDQRELTPTQDQLDYDRLNLGMASKVEWDKQGRVLLPGEMLEEVRLGKEVQMVGVHDHLELWDRSEWEAERAALKARRALVDAKARQARQAPPPA